jgi:outer membrane immunogenic protein
MKIRALKDRLLRGTAALPLLIASPAFAASPAYNWSGFYVGLTAGATWSSSHETTSLPCTEALGVGDICSTVFPANGPIVRGAMTGSFDKTGFVGGGEAGFNLQNGPAVYGIELDLQRFQGAWKSVTAISAGPLPTAGMPMNLNSSADADWLFTARGRIGYAFDSFLVYGTGGLALTRLSTNFTLSDSGGDAGNWTQVKEKVGWVAGGGVEWMLSKTWSVKGEYLYVKFGSQTASGSVVNGFGYTNAISTSADLTAQIARAGLNYKF